MNTSAQQSPPSSGENAIRAATQAQHNASDPNASVWVSASAGSGKTKVLTDRVLRLLMPRADGTPGTMPHKILCLTFTKTAASEMALRLNSRLAEWAVIPEAELAETLGALLGRTPARQDLRAARRLFSRVLDTPGGLQIVTIHAFCESILGRFPLEAGLTPHFRVMDESEAPALLKKARDKVIAAARAQPDSPAGQRFHRLARLLAENHFDEVIHSCLSQRQVLATLAEPLRAGADHDTEVSRETQLYATLSHLFEAPPDKTPEDLIREAVAMSPPQENNLRRFTRIAFETVNKMWRGEAQTIARFLAADIDERFDLWDGYADALLANERANPRNHKGLTNAFKQDPALEDILLHEQHRVLACIETIRACNAAAQSRDLLLMVMDIANLYSDMKAAQGCLDFDDLIEKARTLLARRDITDWVMYKLDGGIDHILVDEAQDTNPGQWDIVRALAGDFFSGEGATTSQRTVFAVGDEKQSIYGFQNADPEKFREMGKYFKAKAHEAGQKFLFQPMNVSFRSGPAVLDFVDRVFADPAIRQGVSERPIKHEAARSEAAGLIELWPMMESDPALKVDKKSKARPDYVWRLPEPQGTSSRSGSAQLAKHIADKIAHWLRHGERLEARNRPIAAGDILILFRRRTASLMAETIRALKQNNVPVGGMDRLALMKELVVLDLLAAAQTALNAEDDYTLACLLKSPLIGWTDGQIEPLAAGRPKGVSLWQRLQDNQSADCQNAAAYIRRLDALARTNAPYEFLIAILHNTCPADATNGERALRHRLGDECLDPLFELLQVALDFAATGRPSLQLFLTHMQKSKSEIKREQEEQGSVVRLMTVHAAKGLQAPIVFLPDTAARSNNSNAPDKILWPQKTGLPLPLWNAASSEAPPSYRALTDRIKERNDEELRRLFYVALTRAEDRLYIAGAIHDREQSKDCWYNLAKSAMESLKMQNIQDDGFTTPILRYGTETPTLHSAPSEETEQGQTPDAQTKERALPAWVRESVPPEPDTARPLSPSRAGQVSPASSPLGGEGENRFRRGILTHTLLQYLPDLPPEQRAARGQAYLARNAPDIGENLRADILKEVLAITENPAWRVLFDTESQAEVSVTGVVEDRVVSGQIDRLAVKENEVLIVDYKTNRPPPGPHDPIPEAYRTQMTWYRKLIAPLFKGKTVRCFLLWTDGPSIREIPDTES